MIFNILDQRRDNEYNPMIDVVYEIFDVTSKSERLAEGVDSYTEWQARTTVTNAIETANSLVGKVTLFMYDPGSVIANFGLITVIHPKIKRDTMILGQMELDLRVPDEK